MNTTKEAVEAGSRAAWEAYLDFVRENGLLPDPSRDFRALVVSRLLAVKIAILPHRFEDTKQPNHKDLFPRRNIEPLLNDLRTGVGYGSISNVLYKALDDMTMAAWGAMN